MSALHELWSYVRGPRGFKVIQLAVLIEQSRMISATISRRKGIRSQRQADRELKCLFPVPEERPHFPAKARGMPIMTIVKRAGIGDPRNSNELK